MGKKLIFTASLLLLAFSLEARAEFSFACGEGKDKGPSQAEIGLLDSLETAMKLYLKGEEAPDEALGIKPTDSGVWIASIDLGEGKGQRRFEFSQKNSLVQEFFTDAKGKDKKVGPPKTCVFKQWEPKPE